MSRGRLLLLLSGLAMVLAPAPAAEAVLQWRSCEFGEQCAALRVPLDRSGALPGTLSLRVLRERSPGRGASGATLVLGAQPGQSAVQALERGEGFEVLAEADRTGRIYVLDQRGTGGSGALRCRDLEAAAATDAGREAEACATLLGPKRGLFGTAAAVEDVEALRAELGVERLTLVGMAYGGYVAQRYALRYPDRVERMVLDAPVDAAGLDPLALDSFAAARRLLPALCRTCRFTSDPVADSARLSDRMATQPLEGHVVGGDGQRRRAFLTPQELLFTFARGDAYLFGLLDYPAAVVSALRGDPGPLLRLKRRAVALSQSNSPAVFSAAARAAVVCEEVRFPWRRDATTAERHAAIGAALALLPPEAVAPFGAGAATHNELVRLCRRWPAASAAPPDPPGPMPDVPVLVLASDTLVSAPLESARRAAERFARGELVVAPTFLTTPLAEGANDCVERALRRFFAGADPSSRCPRLLGRISAGVPAPTSVRRLEPVAGVPGARGRVLRAVALTLDDVITAYLSAAIIEGDIAGGIRTPGLRGGLLSLGPGVFSLQRYEFVPGVRLSMRQPTAREGVKLRVAGPGRLDGRLRLAEAAEDDVDDSLSYRVRGRLGGRRVRARVSYGARFLGLLVSDDSGGLARAAAWR